VFDGCDCGISQVFVQPLKEARVLSAFELASIFSNIEYILALNEDLVSKLNTLSERRSQDQIIGPIFFHFVCLPTLP
jgi:AmiR/NasT family two-component response regulator